MTLGSFATYALRQQTAAPTPPRHTRTFSWDDETFPSYAHVLPEDKNGNWKTETLNLLRHPSDTASSIASSLHPSIVYHKASIIVEDVSSDLSTHLNSAFQDQDAPEIYNSLANLIPSVSMPNMHQLNQTFDSLTDSASSLVSSLRSSQSLQEQPLKNQYTFAHEMGRKAREALVEQGICAGWQIMSSRESVGWQSKLEDALMRLFRLEKTKCSVDDLFGMKPVWRPDGAEAVWCLELDSGWTEIITCGAASFEEVPVFLQVEFELPEAYGSAKVGDVRMKLMAGEEDDWEAV